MENIRLAIYNELFLESYSKWQIGHYYSSKGMLKIDDMSTNHIINAINSLEKKLEIRLDIISKLISDGEIINQIKESYQKNQDIISIKIRELEWELGFRDENAN